MSERLGHDSVATTLSLYAHVTPLLRQDAAARIAALVIAGARLGRFLGNREPGVSRPWSFGQQPI